MIYLIIITNWLYLKGEMTVVFYKDLTNEEKGSGPMARFFKALRKERPPQLWSLVKETIEDVRKASDLKALERLGWVEKMPKTKCRLYEFRIPPNRQKGVVRMYFGYSEKDPQKIIILSAEIKKNGRKKADPEKISQAEARYKEVCK